MILQSSFILSLFLLFSFFALCGQVTRSSEIPWCCHFLMVTEAFLGHDVPCPVLNSNDAGYDEFVAVAHGCDYYLCYCYYFVMMIDVENSFYFSFDDFETIF